MAKAPWEAAENSSWNIPPPDKAGQMSWLVRAMARARNWPIWVARASEPREKELLDVLKETCADMGIKKIPRLILYDDYKPNASSITFTGEVMFSTNLLEIMPRDEVKAVMAHELTHHTHRGRDASIMGLNIALTEIAAFMGYNLVNRWRPTKQIGNVVKFVALTEIVGDIAGILGFGIVQNWFQRRAEKEADIGGAKFAGTTPMINSLKDLEVRSEEIRQQEEQDGKFNWRKYTVDLPLFRSHPSTKDRIKNILAHAPAQSFVEQYASGDKSQSMGHGTPQ